MAKCSRSQSRSRKCTALKLNGDLLMSIITKTSMPVQTILQWRCVCKTWNIVLADHYHKDLFQLLSLTPLWLTVPARRLGFDLAAYDTAIECWQKWRSIDHSKWFSLYDVCGGAGNWLLVRKSSILGQPSQGLWLANPTKKFFTELPVVPGGRDMVPCEMGIGPDASSELCRIFAVTVDREEFWLHTVYLFDFELDSWKEFGVWQKDETETVCSMTFYEGTLYGIRTIRTAEEHSVTCVYFVRHEGNLSLQKFPLGIEGTVTSICFLHLFQWRGQLMLIGGVVDGLQRYHGYNLSSVRIWQLDRKSHTSVESMKMPDHALEHLFVSDSSRSSFSVTCATCNDQVCVTSTTVLKGDIFVRSRHVICDLSQKIWYIVPEPPFQCQDVSRFSVLMPSLAFDKEKL